MVQPQESGKMYLIKNIGSQLLATLSMHVVFFSLGAASMFPTVVLPALLQDPQGLVVTEEQASWFGSLGNLTQLLGAILSGPVVGYLGRTRSLYVLMLPLLVSWPLFHYVQGVWSLLLAAGLQGVGAGMLESPVYGYICEVSEPSMRTPLSNVAAWCCLLGGCVTSYLATVLPWRQVALLALVPTLLALLPVVFNLMPESPEWLLMHRREGEALSALRALRGWPSEDLLRPEFNEIAGTAAARRACELCSEGQREPGCEHDRMNMFKRFLLQTRLLFISSSLRRPFVLVIIYFLFYGVVTNFTSGNFVNFCDALGMAGGGKTFLVNITAIMLFSIAPFVAAVRLLGKRLVSVLSFLLMTVFLAALSVYARASLDSSVFSYDARTFPKQTSYLPAVLFYLYNIATVFNVGWMLLGEVFPVRSRAIAQGLAASVLYITNFLVTKMYITIESYLKLWGSLALFASISFLGTIYLYLYLPETEGKTLTEVEQYFSGESQIYPDDPIVRCFKKSKPIKS